MADLDVLALLVEHVSAELVSAGTDLPDRFDERPGLLPFVQVRELPSSPRFTPWNGAPLADGIEVDIDLFAAGLEQAADLAKYATPNLRDVLDNWHHDGIIVTRRTIPTRRPDRNPHVQRFGCVYSFLARRG